MASLKSKDSLCWIF